jgi:hypothetical protein
MILAQLILASMEKSKLFHRHPPSPTNGLISRQHPSNEVRKLSARKGTSTEKLQFFSAAGKRLSRGHRPHRAWKREAPGKPLPDSHAVSTTGIPGVNQKTAIVLARRRIEMRKYLAHRI